MDFKATAKGHILLGQALLHRSTAGPGGSRCGGCAVVVGKWGARGG